MRDELISDLSPFADIAVSAPTASEKDGKINVKLVRDGRALRISVDKATGKVGLVSDTGASRAYSNFSTLLASEYFSNLRKWADVQQSYLRRHAVSENDLLPIRANSSRGELVETLEAVEKIICHTRTRSDSSEILLIDGPAGIGKSTLIEQLALRRAERYRNVADPLILHVKSRGRVLSNLQDLMAFSLQTLRLHITYDQIPILVKHGLVILAIDGFDELGDPNGYELAWAQVNDLVSSVRGKGLLILAGRDTFIGRDRLIKNVKSIRPNIDAVTELALDAPTPFQAKQWLSRKAQWSEASFDLPAISVLLDQGSYALRPVFLRLLRDQVRPRDIKVRSEPDLTEMLISAMIVREATKFGTAVEAAMTLSGVESFLRSFLREVAREMADSQAESMDATALTWAAEAALGDDYSEEIASLVKNRSQVIAFLSEDDRSGHLRFSHVQIMNYFLSQVTIETVGQGEIPKYLRRNTLAKDFLTSFADILYDKSSKGDKAVDLFYMNGNAFAKKSINLDRTARNLGALLISGVPSFEAINDVVIGGYHVDEALIKKTAPRCTLQNLVINQLDVRGADLSAINFSSVTIVQLIVDETTRLSMTFPSPSALLTSNGILLADDASVNEWIDEHGRKLCATNAERMPPGLRAHPAYKLLGRVCRQKRYWLRSEGDIHAAKIINDEWWLSLSKVLNQHDCLKVENDRPASGRSSTFYHVKHTDVLLTEDFSIPWISHFFWDLAKEVGISSMGPNQ